MLVEKHRFVRECQELLKTLKATPHALKLHLKIGTAKGELNGN
jgi:hypothetical protein